MISSWGPRASLGQSIVSIAKLAVSVALLMGMRVKESRAEEAPTKIQAAEGKLEFAVPAAWKSKEPAIRMIEHEFVAPAAKDDPADGRLTLMMAGGTVQANLDRWRSQFVNPAGGAPEAKEETLQVGEHKVQLLDLRGTYQDRRGPAAPAVARPNYRMLGAIVEVPNGGLLFLKFYGPQATMEQHAEAFHEMLKSMHVVDAKK